MRRGHRIRTITKVCKVCSGTGQDFIVEDGHVFYVEDVCPCCHGEGTVEILPVSAYSLVEVGPACVYNETPVYLY